MPTFALRSFHALRVTARAAVPFAALTAAGCSNDVSVTLNAKAVPTSVAWYDLAAFRGTSCKVLLPNVSSGIPKTSSAFWTGSRAADKSPMAPLGDLPPGDYAFVAIAKDGSCSVLAAGCTDESISGGESVTIVLKAASSAGGGACAASEECIAGGCVPR